MNQPESMLCNSSYTDDDHPSAIPSLLRAYCLRCLCAVPTQIWSGFTLSPPSNDASQRRMRFTPVHLATDGRKVEFYAGRARRRNVADTADSKRDLKVARLLTPFCLAMACKAGSAHFFQSRASVARINGTTAFSAHSVTVALVSGGNCPTNRKICRTSSPGNSSGVGVNLFL
jgi:hypothetical protein